MTDPITVTAYVAVSPETAWRVWTTPETICRWNFASPDWECPSAENDLRPGGAFSYRMAARDGSMAFDFAGTFETVTPCSRLDLRLGDGREVHITFEAEGGGTRVTEAFETDGEAPRELQQAGWQAILDNFKRVAESA